MKKTKVLHIITRFIRGGADENTLITAAGNAKKYDVTLAFGSEYNSDFLDEAKNEKIKIKILRNLRHNKFLSYPFAFFEILSFLKKEKFDIVHTHTSEAGFLGRIAAKIAGVPIIVHTVHGTSFTEHRSFIMNKIAVCFERFCAGFTDKIISNSEALTEEYLSRKIGKSEKYATVASGINLKRFSPKPLPKNKIVTFAFAGRLAEQKGVMNLVLAAKKLEKEKLKIIIAGGGELREKIEHKIKELGIKNISMLGEVKNIVPVIESADAVVVPSLWEGTPRIIYEAMAVGRAVIASDVHGVKNQVIDKKTGLLVSPGDADELSEKMLLLAKNPEMRKSMGLAAAEASKKFGHENLVNGVEDVYFQLLKQKRIKIN